LIVGKFFPPHRGHRYLIETACSQVDRLTVFVCSQPEQTPPAELRAAWLREIHPNVEVRVVADEVDADDSAGWATFCRTCLGYNPEVVFSSEEYGDRFAHFLGCRHIQVDRARRVVPISATQVRANPWRAWEFLDPPVRGYYALRVCIVGAESTGKTTLAAALATELETNWVPEYGRELSERKLAALGRYEWRSEEFVEIARKQCELEDWAAREANRVLVCDTDAFATPIWHERYLGSRSPEVERIAANHRRPDLYLLSDVNIPFVQDGTRDGEQIRTWMHGRFIERLTGDARRFLPLRGTLSSQLEQAKLAIADVMRRSLEAENL
jgi:NadR type nicotinamide-nucleotide adenylyltransferase